MNTEHQKPEAGGSPVDCQVRPCLACAMELERHVSGDRYSEPGRAALDGLMMAEIKRLRDQVQAQDAEIQRLQRICVAMHDRLLRGDNDRDLLALVADAWKLRPNA